MATLVLKLYDKNGKSVNSTYHDDVARSLMTFDDPGRTAQLKQMIGDSVVKSEVVSYED